MADPLPVAPSPNIQAYETIVPSESDEVEPSKVTSCAGCGPGGEKLYAAVGG